MSIARDAELALKMLPQNFSHASNPDFINDHFHKSYLCVSKTLTQKAVNDFVGALLDDARFSFQMEIVTQRWGNLRPFVESVFTYPELKPSLVMNLLNSRDASVGFYLTEVKPILSRRDLPFDILKTIIYKVFDLASVGSIVFDLNNWLEKPLTYDDIADIYLSAPDYFFEWRGRYHGKEYHAGEILAEAAARLDENMPSSWVKKNFDVLRTLPKG